MFSRCLPQSERTLAGPSRSSRGKARTSTANFCPWGSFSHTSQGWQLPSESLILSLRVLMCLLRFRRALLRPKKTLCIYTLFPSTLSLTFCSLWAFYFPHFWLLAKVGCMRTVYGGYNYKCVFQSMKNTALLWDYSVLSGNIKTDSRTRVINTEVIVTTTYLHCTMRQQQIPKPVPGKSDYSCKVSFQFSQSLYQKDSIPC